MDKLKFYEACAIIGKNRERSGIGTLGEKTLHAVLKRYFEGENGISEVKIGSFVADIVNEKGFFEIQTRGFERLRGKLDAFLAINDVTVVYPVAHTKYLCWINEETGEISPKRKSPKTGTVYDALDEMYKIKFSLKAQNLHFCFVMLEMTEYRRLNGWSKDKKKGSTRFERIPDALVDEVWIDGAGDYAKLVPEGLGGEFTVKEFGKAAKLGPRAAQNAVNVLKYVGAVTLSGKRGNAHLYKRAY